MRLRLDRVQCDHDVTIGKLSIDDSFECYTLEDPLPADGVKVPGRTCIPAGLYPLVITWSPRFKRDLILLQYVPQFTGVRIHAGNTVADTEGCILVGMDRMPKSIGRSQRALARLQPKVATALQAGELVAIEIVNPAAPQVVVP